MKQRFLRTLQWLLVLTALTAMLSACTNQTAPSSDKPEVTVYHSPG